jgi:acetyl esterase
VSILGRTYLERGSPVVVLIQWGPGGGPRNVMIQRQDGTKVVRPFRGLRRRTDEALRPDAEHGP